jgi:3-oxoacyl-[acyl-carrier-protein] synthase-3
VKRIYYASGFLFRGNPFMKNNHYSVITATGSYIPDVVVQNEDHLQHEFYGPDMKKFDKTNEEIIKKLEEITGISERRHVGDDLMASDIAFFAAEDAFNSSGIDRESLDYIIVAHNFGDVKGDNKRSDFVPTLASRVKHKLQIRNPHTVAYDLPFGCPGWLMGFIQADCFIKVGIAKKVLIIGAETLSRVSDPHDRDSMIYADGAGATIVEATKSEEPIGVVSYAMRTDTIDHAYMLWMDKSYNPHYEGNDLFLKMHGHKLYKYALRTVPQVVRECLSKQGLSIEDVRLVLLHQANEKMDEAILKSLYKSYGVKDIPPYVMPMTISWLGNSSVATLPTLLDLLVKRKLENYHTKRGDIVVFASVGAGMNVNAMAYIMP